jgi:ribosomal protein L32
MFGLSLGKLVLTVVVVWLVWMVFKRIGATARGNRPRVTPAERARQAAEATTRARTGQDEPPTLDLVACPSCGNYITAGSTCSCGYKDRSGPTA